MRGGRRSLREETGMLLPLYLGAIVGIVAVGVILFQIGRFVLLNSDAQTAADAAALAGAREIARQCRLQETVPHHPHPPKVHPCRAWELIDAPILSAARSYAARNGAKRQVSVRRVQFDVLVQLRTDEELGEGGRRFGVGDERGDARARATVSRGGPGGTSLASSYSGSSVTSTSLAGVGGSGLSMASLSKAGLSKGPSRSCEDVVKLGRQLQSQGFQAGENAALGDPPLPGVHSASGWHYRCGGSGAIDVNCDGCPGGEPAQLTPLAARARALGFGVLWQVAGHFDHVHIDPGGSTGLSVPSLGSGTSLASFGRTVSSIAGGFGLGGGGMFDVHLVSWDGGDGGGFPSGFTALASASSSAAPPAGADPQVVATACGVADQADLSDKQTLAMFEAGIVESGMRNLSYGHSSSVGWLQLLDIHGTFEQRTDPTFAALWFVNGLNTLNEDAYPTAGLLAQAVQRSAFPDRYDQVQSQALALIESNCTESQNA
jgi:hypothetical protein